MALISNRGQVSPAPPVFNEEAIDYPDEKQNL
jgi:hypothetical protein